MACRWPRLMGVFEFRGGRSCLRASVGLPKSRVRRSRTSRRTWTRFARDERFRRRLIAAIGAAAAAQRRARRQAGWVGLATRLSSDPVLRAQLAQAVEQLQKARSRKSRRRHTMRNATLILGGVTVAVAAVPDLRDPMISQSTPPLPSGLGQLRHSDHGHDRRRHRSRGTSLRGLQPVDPVRGVPDLYGGHRRGQTAR